jgi:hypothetical protein
VAARQLGVMIRGALLDEQIRSLTRAKSARYSLSDYVSCRKPKIYHRNKASLVYHLTAYGSASKQACLAQRIFLPNVLALRRFYLDLEVFFLKSVQILYLVLDSRITFVG